MNIIRQAFRLAAKVERFRKRARVFFYHVMLSGHACPKCGGKLAMVKEGLCRCRKCDQEFDPTVAFQTCSQCGGEPMLRVRRYQCSHCGSDVASKFLFDGLVFDLEYFRQKMAESRQRKTELRERVQQMLAESRSGAVQTGPVDLAAVPGLIEALNGLSAGIPPDFVITARNGFDLNRYQSHVAAHIQPFEVGFDEIPPLSENLRIDRVWRFIAIIFLAHAGVVDIRQDGLTIWVSRHETDTEGQGVPGNLADLDEFAGSVRGIESG